MHGLGENRFWQLVTLGASRMNLLWVLLPALLLTISLVLSACQAVDGNGLKPYTAADAQAASNILFPKYVTADVQDAYKFAVSHPDVLEYIPCYCGCGRSGAHANTLDCFIEGVEADGSIRFEDHGSF